MKNIIEYWLDGSNGYVVFIFHKAPCVKNALLSDKSSLMVRIYICILNGVIGS